MDEAEEVTERVHPEIEVTTPRRDEITTMIREAGFDSAINEKLLRPIPNIPEKSNELSQELGSSPQITATNTSPGQDLNFGTELPPRPREEDKAK